MRSYVISNEKDLNSNEENNESKEQQQYRKELGNKAELCVLDDLRAKGYIAQRMPENNPGYDLVATNPSSGESFYVEVKGDSSRWSDKGVGISKRQYDEAVEKGASYYLAIVDNLSVAASSPIYIKNPISYITEYRFDSGWSDLSSNLDKVLAEEAAESILVQLQSETEDAVCKEILKYCDDMSYPFPEIGAELQDDSGRVVLENIEMLWEVERIAIFSQETSELDAIKAYQNWTVMFASEYTAVARVLRQNFGDL